MMDWATIYVIAESNNSCGHARRRHRWYRLKCGHEECARIGRYQVFHDPDMTPRPICARCVGEYVSEQNGILGKRCTIYDGFTSNMIVFPARVVRVPGALN